jgi:hypothetical protein
MELFKALPSSKNIFANSTGYVKEELSADIPKHTVECCWGFLVRDCVGKAAAFRAPSASR